MELQGTPVDVPFTLGVKIRGPGLEGNLPRELHKPDTLKLAETHVIFNSLVAGVCREILRAQSDTSTDNARQLKALLEAAFHMPATAGNHLLTRLLDPTGKDNSDRKQIENVKKRAEKEYESAPEAALNKTLKKLSRSISISTKDVTDTTITTAVAALRQDPTLENLQNVATAIKCTQTWSGIQTTMKRAFAVMKEEVGAIQNEAKNLSYCCTTALSLLDRRATEKYSSWSDLKVALPGPGGMTLSCALSSIPESWQRQIFQAALESLKSHFNLKEYVLEERANWQEARNKLEEVPEVKAYLGVRAAFMEELARVAPRATLKQLNPTQILSVLDKMGTTIYCWRNGEAAPISMSEDIRKLAASFSSLPDDVKARRAASFRRDLGRLYPEVGAFFDLHERYERSFARMPGEPTLTIPDPYTNPKHVIWARQQWREIVLPGESGAPASKWMQIRLPLLRVTEDGVESYAGIFTIRGDRRLKGTRREIVKETNEEGKQERREVFTQNDPVTGRQREVRFGAVRLVIDPSAQKLSSVEALSQGDFTLKVLLNRISTTPPAWVGDYLKRKTDPRTKEPVLPGNLIVASFVHDLGGKAVMKAAELKSDVYDGRRPIKYLTLPPFEVPGLPSAEKVENLRFLVGKLLRKRFADTAELDLMPRDDKALRPERRRLGGKILRTRRLERKIWAHIENLGDDRSNRFAGAVVRQVEAIRKEYPNHQIAVALDYRADRKPDNHKWSKDFNRLLASTSTGQLLDKVSEACGRLDPPIAVLHFSTFGFDKRTTRAVTPNALPVKVEESTDGKKILKQAPYSPECAVVDHDTKGKLRVSFRSTTELVADNLIERLVTPSRYRTMPSAGATKKVLAELWAAAENEIRRLKNL